MDRSDCRVLFLAYMNDFITVERFAEFYGFDLETANAVIEEGRRVHNFRSDHGIRCPDFVS